MSKKLLKKLHTFITEEKPVEKILLEFITTLAMSNDPANRTIATRYSQFKKHVRELHPTYTESFLRTIAPPRELTLSVIEQNKIRRNDKKLVQFDQDVVDTLYSWKNDASPFKRMAFLQFVSGRRVAEIYDNELGTNPKGKTKSVKMKLDKKTGTDQNRFFTFDLIDSAPIDNKQWKKLLTSTRRTLVGVDKGVYNQRLNRILKRDLRSDITSHDLRSMYGIFRFKTENPDNQNLIGYIGRILNHADTSDSGVAYANFSFVEN